MRKRELWALVALCAISTGVTAQITGGNLHGTFQTDFQYYQDDDAMGINDSTLQGKRTGLNSFLNLTYSSNNLEAGLRMESYLPPVAGYDKRHEGTGIPFKYIRFFDNEWDITAGNFYEQFGNGLIFRTYQDWSLGMDNSLEGIKLKYKPVAGVYIKAVSGVQRYYWDRWDKDDDRGIVSGVDAEVNLNETFKTLANKKTSLIVGGSFVTRNQKDNHPIYKIPKNVASFAGRFSLNRDAFSLLGEYAYKINDPSADNGMIYKPGEALFLQGSYAVKGFSFSVGGKRLDNMSSRSDRNASLNDLMINYLPALNKQHIYALPAIYPYGTQTNGEMGITINTGYKIKKGTLLGGKYGTDLAASYSRITDIDRQPLDSLTNLGQAGTLGYTSEYLKSGQKYFEDFSIEMHRKLNKNLKLSLVYAWIFYNISVIEGHPGEENVLANSAVADFTWKMTARQAIRIELQHLETKEDEGSWSAGLVEYTNKGFFLSVQDQWNHGNPDPDNKLHFLMVAGGVAKGATRIAASYGRQNDGIVCVGGVCRFLPAVSGFSVSLTTSF